MLTRFIRTQLAIFAVVSMVGIAVMAWSYIQFPTLLGLGRNEVTLKLPTSGGLYRFSNVTYRGVEVGKVTEMKVTPQGVQATLSISSAEKIPADLVAEVRSVSAIGEQYVDLRPRTDAPPYLTNGSVITADHATIPAPVGPVLDRVSKLVGTFPKDRLTALLDETYQGFNGAGYDLGSLLDSGATLSKSLDGVADRTRTLVDDSRPLLEGQAQTSDRIRTWVRSLAGFTGQLADDDAQFRKVLQTFPGFASETSGLLNQLKPTLPVLLANLGTVGEILMTYNASLEQLLVLLPPYFAQQQSYAPLSNSTGNANADFAISVDDPPACRVGFLPPSSWRSPDDVSDIDTPDGVYCKLPQDSPLAVRGARNFPCIRKPGKRAPTVAICNSDKPYEPLAMRQHDTGPSPFDPSLIAQGIPVDDRTTLGDDLYAPVQGTPLPPGARPSGTPPAATPLGPFAPPVSPLEAPLTTPPPPPGNSLNGQPIPAAGPPSGEARTASAPTDLAPGAGPTDAPKPPPPPGTASFVAPTTPDGSVPAAPSALRSSADRPAIAFAQYNPRTGEYVGSDGRVYQVTNLVAGKPLPTSWKELLVH